MKGHWATVLGAIIFITGWVWVSRRRIPVGILGKDPAFHIRGRLAVAFGLVTIIIGVAVMIQGFDG